MIRQFTTTVILVASASVFFASAPASASTNEYISSECEQVESVFARGSGQDLEGPEEDNYDEALRSYLRAANITGNHYELGTAHQRGSDGIGYKYPAVRINGGWDGFQNILGASVSSGLRNDYGKSVEDGVKELAIYLNQRFTRGGDCANSHIILAEYSQG